MREHLLERALRGVPRGHRGQEHAYRRRFAAVIGDFSLMALNSRSTLADPRFRLARRKALKLTSLAQGS